MIGVVLACEMPADVRDVLIAVQHQIALAVGGAVHHRLAQVPAIGQPGDARLAQHRVVIAGEVDHPHARPRPRSS